MKTISRALLLTTLMLAAIYLFLDLSTLGGGISGRYFGNGWMRCADEISCLHEVGHFVDESLGFPSLSAEFDNAVEAYIDSLPEECTDPIYCFVQDFWGVDETPLYDNQWGGNSELYATLYSYYLRTGFIPDQSFIPFFSEGWDN